MALAVSLRYNMTQSDVIETQETIVKEKASEVEVWRDRYDRARASRVAAVLTWEEAERHYKSEIDVLKKELGARSAESITTITTVTTDTLTLFAIDTMEVFPTFYQKDDWIEIEATPRDGVMTAVYKVYDSISFAVVHKNHLFKPRETFVEAISYNPNTTFTGMRTLVITERRRLWGVVAGASMGYGLGGPYVGVGITVGIPLR